ncbi:MAG: NfeD family protein [Halolamina sp.]
MLLQSGLLGPETLPLLLVAAGIALSIAEALAPGAHFVVVGVSLLGAGLVGLLLGPAATPFVLAGLVLLIGIVTLYGYRELDIYGGKGQAQTSSSSDLKGQTARVTSRVTPREGEVKIDNGGFNPYYSARTIEGEIPEGEEVMVVDPGGGNVVTVESLGTIEGSLDRELERARAENARREAAAERPDDVAEDAEGDDAQSTDGASSGDDSGWTSRSDAASDEEASERETETN